MNRNRSQSYANQRRGREGEGIAARFLEEKGYSILERNYRTRWGEVDIIARRESILAFVEVKTWRSFSADSLEGAIGRRKRRNIRMAAESFLGRNSALGRLSPRFDVLLLKGTDGSAEHWENAFEGE